jgi:hypothetical protein
MKQLLILAAAFLIAMSVSAIEIDPDLMTAEGSWVLQGDRLVQTDEGAPRAKFAIPYPQYGLTTYEFNVRYEGGVLEDGHGGFGIHIFADRVKKGRAWGAGESWLLWLNYDQEPRGINSGLSAQVYRSVSNSRMDLIADYDLNWALDNLSEMGLGVEDILSRTVTIKLTVDSRTGEVTFFDPFAEDYTYRFTLPIDEPLMGTLVVLRSNGMGISFAQ